MLPNVNVDLKVVADVDDEGSWDWIDGEPAAMVQDLEALNVVLQQECEEAVVRVRW